MKNYFEHASSVVFGCMGLGGEWAASSYSSEHVKQANNAIEAALNAGITVFDHADIYTLGKAEKVFADVLKQNPDWRNNMIIQSKCGIRFEDETGPKRYDFSPAYITQSVDGILQRLNQEYIDILLLHRPDPLADLPALGECLTALHKAGKFRYLGVSNMLSLLTSPTRYTTDFYISKDADVSCRAIHLSTPSSRANIALSTC